MLTAERARPLIDENTIGVCPILGSTFNGEFEDVKVTIKPTALALHLQPCLKGCVRPSMICWKKSTKKKGGTFQFMLMLRVVDSLHHS